MRKQENQNVPDLGRGQEYDNCGYEYAFLAIDQCLEKGIHSNKKRNNDKTKLFSLAFFKIKMIF